ncbi:MAG: hypothetical protein ACOX4R_04210 [Lentihominibacter sp.]|jgi:hypothetical protein
MKKLWVVLVIGLMALVMVGCKGASKEYDMVSLISEEMTANYLYTELARKYSEDELFANMAEGEARNIEALEEVAASLDISVEEAKAEDIEIPETKEEALSRAVDFKKEDIRLLKKMIKNEEDAYSKEVLVNLLKSSEDDYSVLKTAYDAEKPLVMRCGNMCKIREIRENSQ